MPANVLNLIDRGAPTLQHTTANGQHTADLMAADVYCGNLDASATAILHSTAGPRPSVGFQQPTAAHHQLALDLAKLASNLNIGVCADTSTAPATAANGDIPTSLSLSSSTVGGNASPVLSRAPVGAGGMVGSLLCDMSEPLMTAAGGRKSANMTECVPVPSSEHVAEIVGRQGSKIKALRAKTNTYIKTPVRGEEPVFVVTGRREDVAAAKREILSASEHFSQIRASRLNAAGSASPAGAGGGGGVAGRPGGQDSSSAGQVTIHVRVPYRVVGLVVGPKGATIKRIQQDSSTYIVTPSRDREPVFEVTGSCDGVEKARRDIESYIALRTGTAPESAPTPPVLPLTGADQRDVDARILLSSLLKSGPPGASVLQNGAGGVSSAAAALLSYNNAVNLGRLTTPHHSDGGFAVGAGPLKYADKSFPGFCDYDDAALRPDLLSNNNNNNASVEAWSGGVDLSLRSLASLLPFDDYAMRYPAAGVEMPSLDSLVAGGYGLGRPGDGGLCGLVSGGSDSGHSGSGSSPPVTGSPAESATSPRRLQVPSDCLCVLCSDATVSAALVPCGHNLFCKACADAVVSKPDPTERRCPVCGEQASLAIRILS